MGKVKVIVLDFDNTLILDETTRRGSEEVKDEAWFAVFSEYDKDELGSVLEKSKQAIAGGRGDRTTIAAAVLHHFGMTNNLEQEVLRRCEQFNKIVRVAIQHIGISPKNRKAVIALSEILPVYVNTATPREVAKEDITSLGLYKYFKDIYGRPATKLENLKNIIEREGVNPKEVLYVDDQVSGQEVAQEIGCQFVGMHTERNRAWHKNNQPFKIIHSLDEILNIIS